MKSNPCDGVKFLTDAQLVETWGWMQSVCPPDAPIAKAFVAELTKRGLPYPSKPIDFSKISITDLTK